MILVRHNSNSGLRPALRPALAVLLAATSTLAAAAPPLSVWAYKSDLRLAVGDPNASLSPTSIAFNPVSGKLLIACGGNDGAALEWARGATTGTVLVPRANWGLTGNPQPYASAYIPSRSSYFVATGEDDVIYEVLPGVTGQTPAVFVTCAGSTFPAGGLVQDGSFAYYKNQWTGLQQTVNRFTLSGGAGVESEYVPKPAFDAWQLAGPSQQFAIDSAGRVFISGRPLAGAPETFRGIYRCAPDADPNTAALVPVLTFAQIIAHTGQAHVTTYGMVFDGEDALYFYEIYAGAILRWDRHGTLSTFLTNADVRAFMGDPEMQVNPAFMQVVNDELVFISGNVSGHILAARLPAVEPDLVLIPGTDYEPGGPTYAYKLDRFELTNAQYAVFLNDAERLLQTDPNDPRCTNMWIEPVSGDVYMMDVTDWPYGTEWYDRTLYKTSDVPDSKINYAPTRAVGSRYTVLPGFAHHPVGTVSWFGAAKFCNWLTIHNGLGADEVCYHEGTGKYDWYPITAADWANQGLTAAERFALVRQHRGYRLPMDGVNVDNGGPGVAHSWNIGTNPYNEWYKAAAWDPLAPDTERPGPGDYELVPPDHWTFGFGADSVAAGDANILLSNPPYLETTPVGFYDGVNLLEDGAPTTDTRNRYGLYDLCGNAAEWISDTALEAPWSATYRAARSGNFTNDPKWTTASFRIIYTARYYAENTVGFRVLRAAAYGDFDGDDDSDAVDFELLAAALGGPDVSLAPGFGHEAADADGDGDVDLADTAGFAAIYGGLAPL